MKKKGKKILLTLVTAILLSTSGGQAIGFNYRNNTYYRDNYRPNNRVYITSQDKTYYNYLYDWNNINKWFPSRPSTPVEETERPNFNIGKEEDNTQKPKPKPSNPNLEAGENLNTTIEKEVVRLVNIERAKIGLAPLSYSEELARVARIKSQDMADKNYFSHHSPTYGDPFSMLRSFGVNYKIAGENIAKGFLSAESAMRGWMNSSGHRDNILNPSFGKIGVGYVKVNGTSYWTQIFTN